MSEVAGMTEMKISEHAELAAERKAGDEKTLFGFWLYIMTDCVLFASLFATYAVLHNNTYGGPDGSKLFDSGSVLTETLILLTSSFTCGLAMLAARARKKRQVIGWFIVTGLLGLAFLGIEIHEFIGLVNSANSWRRNGFLSAFFTLVGTHGTHITIGLLWMSAMIIKVFKTGLSRATIRRLSMLSYFWHFLDIVWIFIFTVVYMLGMR